MTLPTLHPTRRVGLGEKFAQAVVSGTKEFSSQMGDVIKERKQEKETKELSDFADSLLKNNPDNPALKLAANIYKLQLPWDEKSKLVKNLIGSDPYEGTRKYYLNRDSIASEYDKQIKGLTGLINSPGFSREQYAGFKDKILQLMQEKTQRMAAMDSMYGAEMGFAPKAAVPRTAPPSTEKEEEEAPPAEVKRKKVKFDPNNPEHVAKFKQLDKQFKGDRKKVNDILAREFSL